MIHPCSEGALPPGEQHWPQDFVSRVGRPWDMLPIKRLRGASKEKLRVLFIGFSDTCGGAAIASLRLISKLDGTGEIAPLEIVSVQESDSPWTISLGRAYRSWRQLRTITALRNVLASDPYGWLPFERNYLRRALDTWQPHVIHLHNLHGGRGTIPLAMMPELARRAPIIWTLHDMWGVTGHCAYPLECEGWRRGCGNCPDLSLYPKLLYDRTRQIVENKRMLFAESSPMLVSPSRWLAMVVTEAEATEGLDVKVIPNGVDLALFSPAGREATRLSMGIECGAPVLMFAAQTLDGDIRKGAKELRTALERVQAYREGAPLDVILMGSSGDNLLEGIPGLTIHNSGFVSDPIEAAGLYAAADLFLCPSLQDNLPNTLIEAAACGTAAVSFDSGGCGEIIEDGVSGVLVPVRDAESFGAAIARLVADPCRLERMGQAARIRAENFYSDERMASDYLSLYREMIRRWRA